MAYSGKKVYVLSHVYEYGENDEFDEIKELGIYSTKQKAEEAIERYYILSGFKRYPRSCFQIREQKVDLDFEWTDGFMTDEDIERFQVENDICRDERYKRSNYDDK